ncbi:hypothetical protein Q3G72_021986 [Acer saccharum]|nr:hypothetical protein Q3G72_021986 [Acer saccharum]
MRIKKAMITERRPQGELRASPAFHNMLKGDLRESPAKLQLPALAITDGATDSKHQHGTSLDRGQRTSEGDNEGRWKKRTKSRIPPLDKE